MAKINGIPVTFSLQNSAAVAKDISNDVTDFTLDIPYATQDTTGLDKSGHERITLLGDCKITLKGVHNNSTDRIHPVLSVGQTTPRQAVVTLPGGAGSVLTATCVISDYKLTRAANGSLVADATLELSNGSVAAWS